MVKGIHQLYDNNKTRYKTIVTLPWENHSIFTRETT